MNDALFDTIKDILTVGGGTIGAGSGLLDFGATSLPGALAGAGLGRGAGEAIKNLYKQQSNQPVDTNSPYKEIPAGSEMEMGGQVGGQLLGKMANALMPKETSAEILSRMLAQGSEGSPRIEMHGSDISIPNPQKGFVKGGSKGNQVFFTTPDPEVANSFGIKSIFMNNPEKFGFNTDKFPSPVINKYAMAPVNELKLTSPISMEKASDLGQTLGLKESDINESIKNSIYNGGIDSDMLWNQYLARHAGKSLPSQIGDSVQEAGNAMVDTLKNQGYRRFSTNMDPGFGSQETVHFYPEEDLYHIGSNKFNMNPQQQKISSPAQDLLNQISRSLATQEMKK